MINKNQAESTLKSSMLVLGMSSGVYIFFIASFLLIAFLETLGVGIIPIFVAVLVDPEMLSKLHYFNFLISDAADHSGQLIRFSVFLICLFILKNSLLLLLGYRQARYIVVAQARLSSRLLSSYLYRPYLFHLQINSAELVRNTSGLAFSIFSGYVIPSCTLVTEALVVLMVTGLLSVSNPVATICAVIFFGTFMFVLHNVFKRKVSRLGEAQQKNSAEVIKWITQALGGVKESKVLGRESFFIDSFNRHVYAYSENSTYLQVISQVPKYIIETITVTGLVFMVLVLMKRGDSPSEIIAVLTLFGVAALRMMPSVNRIMSSLTLMRFNASALDIISKDLVDMENYLTGMDRDKSQRVNLSRAITIDQLSFTYPGASTHALKEISLTIGKGEMVAFVGQSGAGKSTLADVILGLFEPSGGRVRVDGYNIRQNIPGWQANMGYVPQNIFISDDSIRRNVAFGLPDHEIEDEKVENALQKAQLKDFVETLPDGIDTIIGERGGRLSGGQRQRIGIARALYHDPDVLVMDEATSALDNRTEREISTVLQGLVGQKTIIVIAHRLSTIEKCQKLFLFQEGRLLAAGTYEDLALNNAQFQSLTDIRRDELDSV